MEPAEDILILYATETGTAQDAAECLDRHIRRRHRHLRPRVTSIEQYDPGSLLSESIVFFIISTTGNGVEPATMTPFWHALLRTDLPLDLLDHLDFAMLALGDSSYERFCWAGKKLQRRLNALGANEIVSRVDADEQDRLGIDGALSSWLEILTKILDEIYPPLESQPPISPSSILPPTVNLAYLPSSSPPQAIFDPPNTLVANLHVNQRITRPDWFQDVRHIELQLEENIHFKPGDIAVLYPSNDLADVEKLIHLQEWAAIAHDPFNIEPRDPLSPLPILAPQGPATLLFFLLHYLDITAVPRRSFFEWCWHFASDEREKEKLGEFCGGTPEGSEDLFDYSMRPRRTIIEVLSEFKSVRIPREYVFDVFKPIRPRKFSIAGAAEAHPRRIQLCVAIVRYKSLSLRAPRKGLCTSWLSKLDPGTPIHVGIEKGVLSMPTDPSTPIICIGPGTGIAPIRALIEERVRIGAHDNLLFVGCRSKSADCHYHQEWEEYQQRNELRVRVAASRDQDTKVYVQDLIREDAEILYNWLVFRKGVVYISGSSNKMPSGVRSAVQHILVTQTVPPWSDDQAKEYIENMEREGRWQEECWS